MAGDISTRDGGIESAPFDLTQVVSQLLPRGHVIHGYSSANHTRVLSVLESREYSDHAPLLGFGMDGTAELALGRALLTYAMRERDGLEYITETHYPVSTEGRMRVNSGGSVFDVIVWGGHFKLYQEGEDVVAWSEYSQGGYMHRPIQSADPDALTAIKALGSVWRLPDGPISRLPLITLARG